MTRQTFNYQPHNVCGGPSHRHVHQGPKKSICVGTEWVNLDPAPAKPPKPVPQEGHYVSREKGTMRVKDFQMLMKWRKNLEMRGQWPGEYKYYPCPRPYYPNN